jgi:hypothetical protein
MLRAQQQGGRDRQAEHLRRREVGRQLEPGGLLDGQGAGTGTPEDPVDGERRLPGSGGSPVRGSEMMAAPEPAASSLSRRTVSTLTASSSEAGPI